jgi:hypothetical protein
MSWKNIKEHYRIEHIVQAGKNCMHVGSPYVSDILTIYPDGRLQWGILGPSDNDDLARYYAEMSADSAKLVELYSTPDVFDTSLPVYTYKGGEIIEEACEAYGWPNLTHCGNLMHDNTYSSDKDEVVGWAKENCDIGIKWGNDRIEQDEKRLEESRTRLATEQMNRAKLEFDYPSLNESKSQLQSN